MFANREWEVQFMLNMKTNKTSHDFSLAFVFHCVVPTVFNQDTSLKCIIWQ